MGVNSSETVLKEAFLVFERCKTSFEVLRDGIDPIFSMRVRLDLFLFLIVLEGYIELEAFGFLESRLHDSIPAHPQDVGLFQLFKVVIEGIIYGLSLFG